MKPASVAMLYVVDMILPPEEVLHIVEGKYWEFPPEFEATLQVPHLQTSRQYRNDVFYQTNFIFHKQ